VAPFNKSMPEMNVSYKLYRFESVTSCSYKSFIL